MGFYKHTQLQNSLTSFEYENGSTVAIIADILEPTNILVCSMFPLL